VRSTNAFCCIARGCDYGPYSSITRVVEMWSCRDTSARVTDLLADALTLAERVDLGLHLASCRHCRQHMAQLQATVDLLRSLPGATGASSIARFEPFHHFGRTHES
jgi:hypothetical protein